MADLQTPSPIQTNVGPDSLSRLGVPGFSFQSAQANTVLNTGVRVPGQRLLPQGRLEAATRRNKTTTRSNEPIVGTLTPVSWRQTHWEKFQKPGDLLFVGVLDQGTKRRRTDVKTLNLPQLQELLRIYYEKALDSSQEVELAPVNEFLANIRTPKPENVTTMTQYQQYGEQYFSPLNEAVFKEVHYKLERRPFTGLSRRHILQSWTFAGAYMSDDGRDDVGLYRTVNCCFGGPTTYQEVFNYWGNVQEGQNLLLILKRRFDPLASTTTKSVYAEFYLQPWAGFDPVPPDEDLEYYDDAGILQYGSVFPVGQVYRAPMDVSPESVRLAKAGISGREVSARDLHIETVSIIMGPRRVCLDMYHF